MERLLLVIVIAYSSLVSCGSLEDDVIYSDSKDDIAAHNLISPVEAHELITERPHDHIVIQVSKQEIFQKGHIPQALNIWRPDYGSDSSDPYEGLIPSRAKLLSLIQSFGFEKGHTLLLYDAKGNVDALRFAWVLELYGFHDFKIINGGLRHWEMSGLPLSIETSSPLADSSNFLLPEHFNKEIIANYEDVMAAMDNENVLLIDTREDYEYYGQPYIHRGKVSYYKSGAFDRGSIPGAIHLNWSTLADLSGDHRVKSEKDLRYDLDIQGIAPDKQIILYCHSGSRTSHTYYVLKHILGYKNVKNYDGSWIEWSYLANQNDDIPIEKITPQNKFEYLRDSLTNHISENHGKVL